MKNPNFINWKRLELISEIQDSSTLDNCESSKVELIDLQGV